MLGEPRIVLGWRGNIAEIQEYIQGLIAHAGNKDILWLIKHPMIRLERR